MGKIRSQYGRDKVPLNDLGLLPPDIHRAYLTLMREENQILDCVTESIHQDMSNKNNANKLRQTVGSPSNVITEAITRQVKINYSLK